MVVNPRKGLWYRPHSGSISFIYRGQYQILHKPIPISVRLSLIDLDQARLIITNRTKTGRQRSFTCYSSAASDSPIDYPGYWRILRIRSETKGVSATSAIPAGFSILGKILSVYRRNGIRTPRLRLQRGGSKRRRTKRNSGSSGSSSNVELVLSQ